MLSDWSGAGTITEQEILYLADKLLSGTELKTLEARRAESLERKGRTPEIREAITENSIQPSGLLPRSNFSRALLFCS